MTMEASIERAAPPAGRYRWTICALLFMATTINYMDRQVLGLLAPLLQKDIGWSQLQYSQIVVAFQVAYAIGLLGFGRLIDTLGTRFSYAGAMAFWSAAAMLHALVGSVAGFAGVRFLLGLGESGNFPSAIKAVAEWFPKRERALATGIFNAGANAGAVIAPALIPLIAMHWGWRGAFAVIGAAGFLWLLLWLPLFGTPSRLARVSAEERAYIEQDEVTAAPTATLSWLSLLGYRETWAFIAGKFLTDPVWWFYLFWVPKWLNETRHIDIASMGAPIVVIYLISTVGSIGGGYISSAMLKRGHSVNVSRKTGLFVCACCVLPILLATQVQSLWLAVSLVGLAAAGHQGWSANIFTTASDMFPRHALGSVVGLGGMAGSVGAVIFSTVIGNVLERSGNYWVLFLIGACAYLLAFAIMHALVPRMRQIAL
jgi:ACS family hexuronate transporter-like MFS transporter